MRQQEWFYRQRLLAFVPSSSFLTLLSIILHLTSVTTAGIRRYLDPIEVAQLVEFLQDGALMRAIAKKVFQHSLKSMEEISGDSKLLQESWTGSQNALNPSTGLVSFTLFKKEEDQHCQSQIPTKYLQQANGVNLSDHKIRNRPDEGSNGGPCAHSQHCGARLAFLPQNTRIGSSTTGTLCSVLFTNDSRVTLSTCDDCEKILLPVR